MQVRWVLILAATLISFTVNPPLLWADDDHDSPGWHGKHGGRSGHHMTLGHRHTNHYLRYLLRHRQAIGLTDEQVAKLKALQLDFDRTRIRMRAEIKVASLELMALVQDDKADLPSIEAKVKQRGDLAVTLHMAAIKTKREAKALLTPEQREKAKAEREKMMRHRRDCRMGHRAAHASLSPERDAAPSEGEPVQEDHQEFPGSRWAGPATAPEEHDALVSSVSSGP